MGFEIWNHILKKYEEEPDVAEVLIPDGVKKIDNYAFEKCGSIVSITIPQSVTEIGSMAFHKCTNLTSIVIPDSVTKLNSSLFWDCTSLESIIFSDNVTEIDSYVFYNTPWFEKLNDKYVVVGDSILIKYNGNDQNVVIPYGIKKIGASVFEKRVDILTVTIPDSVTKICDFAFTECSNLNTINIPDSVTEIGIRAFSKCVQLGSLYIPSSVKKIGGGAFEKCHNLHAVNIPNGITEINAQTFYCCSNLKAITIPNSVTRIGGDAFEGCTRLVSITIPQTVKTIEYNAFDYTYFAENYKDDFIVINGILVYCKSEKEHIVIPDTAKEITGYVFSCKRNIKSITIPDTVRKINRHAIHQCRNLESITIKHIEKPKSLFDKFSMLIGKPNLNTLATFCNVITIDEQAFNQCPNLQTILIDCESEISFGAFNECTNIKSITFSKTIKKLSTSVFSGLSNVRISILTDSINEIHEFAFAYCKNPEIYIPNIPISTLSNHEELRLYAITGFAKFYLKGEPYNEKILNSNKEYIKSNLQELYDIAFEYNWLLQYMISEKLIPYEKILPLIEKTDDVSIKAMLLEYQNSNFPQHKTEPFSYEL